MHVCREPGRSPRSAVLSIGEGPRRRPRSPVYIARRYSCSKLVGIGDTAMVHVLGDDPESSHHGAATPPPRRRRAGEPCTTAHPICIGIEVCDLPLVTNRKH